MTRQPLVTIVTPTRNRADLLRHTLESVRGQTYAHIEHIVVDGASTDQTVVLLREHKTSHVFRWVSEPDGGMYEAINKGMRMAQGEIVAYLNSDDLYAPWAVEAIVEHFARHPEADFVFGAALSVDDESGQQFFLFHPPFELDYIRRAGFLCQPAVFWRTRAMLALGPFDESLRYVADCEYWMRAGATYRFSKLNELVAIERNHDSTLRQTDADAILEELTAVRERFVKLTGPRHRVAMVRHGLRLWFWRRLPWIGIARQTLTRREKRRGSWARMVNAEQPKVRWPLVPLHMIPGIRRLAPWYLRPSRFWLEPSAE